MALPMVHLAVAYKWAAYRADKKDLFTTPEYYLGAISPDAIHSRPSLNRDDKSKTHLNVSRRSITSLDTIREFMLLHNDPFSIGYGIHILTDYIWTNYYQDNIPEIFDENGKTIPALYYNDTDQVDYMLYDKLPYREYLFDMLDKSISPDLNDLLSSSEIEAWKQRTLHLFEKDSQWKEPVRYVTYERVCHFIDIAPEKINEALNCNEKIIYQ